MDLAPGRPANHARFVFLDPRAHDFFVEWERVADDTVAMLRNEAGRDPHDRNLTDLVGELSTRSEAFRTRWAAHDVRAHQTGTKRYHHPVVGDLELTYEVLELTADPGLDLLALSAEPGSASQRGARPARKLGRNRPARRRSGLTRLTSAWPIARRRVRQRALRARGGARPELLAS